MKHGASPSLPAELLALLRCRAAAPLKLDDSRSLDQRCLGFAPSPLLSSSGPIEAPPPPSVAHAPLTRLRCCRAAAPLKLTATGAADRASPPLLSSSGPIEASRRASAPRRAASVSPRLRCRAAAPLKPSPAPVTGRRATARGSPLLSSSGPIEARRLTTPPDATVMASSPLLSSSGPIEASRTAAGRTCTSASLRCCRAAAPLKPVGIERDHEQRRRRLSAAVEQRPH